MLASRSVTSGLQVARPMVCEGPLPVCSRTDNYGNAREDINFGPGETEIGGSRFQCKRSGIDAGT